MGNTAPLPCALRDPAVSYTFLLSCSPLPVSLRTLPCTSPQSPLLAFQPGSPVLNVRCDCPPANLLEFLASEAGVSASEAAGEVHDLRAREEALLEHVRKVGWVKLCRHLSQHALSKATAS